jgi:hypothetical protein
MTRSLLAALLLSIVISSPSRAARCGEWERQPNGSQMRTCTGDGGKIYCEGCTAGGCNHVKCTTDEVPRHPPSYFNPPPPPPPPRT